MFFASEKEYDLLKKETAEIRDCITKYVGYIIAVTGISSGLVKYLVFTEAQQGQAQNGLTQSDDQPAWTDTLRKSSPFFANIALKLLIFLLF